MANTESWQDWHRPLISNSLLESGSRKSVAGIMGSPQLVQWRSFIDCCNYEWYADVFSCFWYCSDYKHSRVVCRDFNFYAIFSLSPYLWSSYRWMKHTNCTTLYYVWHIFWFIYLLIRPMSARGIRMLNESCKSLCDLQFSKQKTAHAARLHYAAFRFLAIVTLSLFRAVCLLRGLSPR